MFRIGLTWKVAVATASAGAFAAALYHHRTSYCSLTQSDIVTKPSSQFTLTSDCLPTDPVLSAIMKSKRLIKRTMVEQGIPGAVVCVEVNGQKVWCEGIGYADVENDVACAAHTVMRIASISKCLTAIAAMQLLEDGLLDLDAPVQSYVPQFPTKTYDGNAVEITSRQLLCHMGGIRHYTNAADLEAKKGEFQNDEYFIKDHYDSVSDSLKLFMNDDLVHAPGTKFHYTTHGWTLLSAVIESVSGVPFLNYLKSNILSPLGMDCTGPEINNPLTYSRARYYVRNTESGRLENAPFVDISYKWAGGGLFSSALDLCRLGSVLLTCYQSKPSENLLTVRRWIEQQLGSKTPNTIEPSCNIPFLLKPETVSAMWKETVRNIYFSSNPRLSYGMGWIVQREGPQVKGGKKEPFCVGHTGAAVGASSVLLILPCNKRALDISGGDIGITSEDSLNVDNQRHNSVPHGVVVAVLFNLQEVHGMFSLGSKIATIFHQNV